MARARRSQRRGRRFESAHLHNKTSHGTYRRMRSEISAAAASGKAPLEDILWHQAKRLATTS